MSKIISKINFLTTVMILITGIILGFFLTPSIKAEESFIKVHSFKEIIQNNLVVNFSMVSGVITFGVSTLLLLLFNGALIGTSIRSALAEDRMGLMEILFSLIPHGVFEIPALILSAMIGFQLIELIVLMYIRVESYKNLFKSFIKKFLIRLLLMIILTVIAGVVEWYITFQLF
ncbi:stage II sporulation protein M [Staphylococcus aureus]|nr:stage II sporulation protein M [Staphylococcus aureus]MBV2959075.1 stage II sporulation protein M [Staphylococcus aureus]MBV2961673.1 stage II sporulation protein M [Staphylococcus aureus]MBV2964244.1 stage II sporulation protein M [Staphylococcus aureus]